MLPLAIDKALNDVAQRIHPRSNRSLSDQHESELQQLELKQAGGGRKSGSPKAGGSPRQLPPVRVVRHGALAGVVKPGVSSALLDFGSNPPGTQIKVGSSGFLCVQGATSLARSPPAPHQGVGHVANLPWALLTVQVSPFVREDRSCVLVFLGTVSPCDW
jgi:hypothetical protein